MFQTKVGFGNLVGYLGSVLVNQPTVHSGDLALQGDGLWL